MDAKVQQKISSNRATNKSIFDTTKTGMKPAFVGEGKVDFKNLMLNSNRSEQLKKQAKKNGDLSSAKTYDDFIDKLNQKSNAKTRTPKNTLGKDDFLTLFITQIKSQDPLNPKDGTEMASQLAQFNGLEQMMNMNKALGRLEDNANKSHNIQYSSFIGKEVLVENGRAKLEGGKLNEINYKLDYPVSRTIMKVLDSDGNTVVEKEQGAKEKGSHTINWDGKTANGELVGDGVYTFSLVSIGKGGVENDVPLKSKLKITGIDLKNPNESFYTNVGKIGFADIMEIGQEGFLNQNNEKTVESGNQVVNNKILKNPAKHAVTEEVPTNSESSNPQQNSSISQVAKNSTNAYKEMPFYPENQKPFSKINAEI